MGSFRYFSVVRFLLLASLLTLGLTAGAVAQSVEPSKFQSQEVSEIDGVPVLVKHLPDWESVRGQTTLTNNIGDLKAALGERPVLDLIDFTAGTEAVTAPYNAGKLLIIEYAGPQSSVEADTAFKQKLSETGDTTTVYKRIGNYNVFVFDGVDRVAAETLLDQVKYEKQIHWLGDNPFRITAERAFVLTTSDIFLSTVFVILLGIGVAIVGGLTVGIVYFRLRERRRAAMTTYTDAGGMTRLNLDGYTPDIIPERMLGD